MNSGMRPLMRENTPLVKWGLPYAVCAVVMLWGLYEESVKSDPDYLAQAVIWLFMFTVLFFVIRWQGRTEPDQVLDAGTSLQVAFGRAVETIQLADIAEVEVKKFLRLTRLVLHLRKSSSVGKAIGSYPIQDTDSSGENLVAVSLRARIGAGTYVA